MNRIVEVNEELAYAVIEPGVTQQQLYDYLQVHQTGLWMDCTDSTPSASVLGNSLERGIGYTPYGDHFGQLSGLEVVLPDGEIVRTGGGPPNLKTWNTSKWGTGPYVDGLFSQSNFGIVTKAGVWLMPQPEKFTAFFLELADAGDFSALIDELRRLVMAGILQSKIHMPNELVVLALATQYPYDLRGPDGLLSDDTIAALREKYALQPWTMTGGVYGTAEQVRVNRAAIRAALGRFGRLNFVDDRRLSFLKKVTGAMKASEGKPFRSWLLKWALKLLGATKPRERLEIIPVLFGVLQGVPSEHIVKMGEYFMAHHPPPESNIDPTRHGDSGGLLWFPVLVPFTGRHMSEVIDICRPIFRKHRFEFACVVNQLNARTLIALIIIGFDKQNPEEEERAWELHQALMKATLLAGYQQFRTHIEAMPDILSCSPALVGFLGIIKSALDPHQVLAAKRYGVSKQGAS